MERNRAHWWKLEESADRSSEDYMQTCLSFPEQVSGCAVTGKGMLCNIGGKLLAAEQRVGGRTVCAVFADNHTNLVERFV